MSTSPKIRFTQTKGKDAKAKQDEILKKNAHYNDEQVVSLHLKSGRSAQCSGMGCSAIFQIGTPCLKVEGCISIPRNQSFARKENKFFCASLDCIKTPPVWTNIRFPTKIKRIGNVSDAQADALNNELSSSSMVR